MKFILLLLFSTIGFAQQIPLTQSQQGNFQNLLLNAGFENGKASWSNSGGTFTITSSALQGNKSASFTAAATSQYLLSSPIAVPTGMQGKDCMASFIYSGGDANLTLTVVDGANAQVVPIANSLILNSTSGQKTAKLYFTCPSSGSISLKVISSAASAALIADRAFLGEADFNGANNSISATPYTPTFTGFGTPTAVQAFYSRDKDMLEVWGTFTSGVPTAVSAKISLPTVSGSQVSIDFSKLVTTPRSDIGRFFKASAVANSIPSVGYGPFVITTQVDNPSNILLSVSTNSTDFTFPTALATGLAGVGDIFQFRFKVPILGWSALENSINSKCPNDIACTNEFTAEVSSTGVVSGENLDWLNGNFVNPSAGQYNIAFNTGIFTQQPYCIASPTSTVTYSQNVNAVPISFTGVGVVTGNGGVASNQSFNISCRKTGSDFKAKQTIQGFLASTVTSGLNNLRIEKVRIAGATDQTNCTTSPCTLYKNTGAISSVTRSSTGNYLINFLAGTFSDIPSCTYSGANGATTVAFSESIAFTTTSAGITVQTPSTLANIDARVEIICIGPR